MDITKSIKFQTNQCGKLKKAIEAISKSNSSGSGIIEVDPNLGFKISGLPDSNSGTISYCWLEPSNLIEFHCSKPIENKLVNLKFLLRMLQALEDESIILFIEEGSSNLSFESVDNPGMTLGVGLREGNANFEAYSGPLSHTCEVIIPTEGLKAMIPDMVKDGFTQLVTMDISSAGTKILIGKTEREFKSSTEIGENTGTTSSQAYHVEFLWSHVESLENACSLAKECSIAVLPSENIKFQLWFDEGSLVYIKKPLVLTTH